MSAKYPELKRYIIEKINNGEYKVGEMLPTEKEFTQIFNVSRMTVRRALDDLIQDGILRRKSGSGVFLAEKKLERSVKKISVSQDKDILQRYKTLTVKVVDWKIINNHYLAKKYLGIENEDILQLKRVQFGDGQPIVYENLFLPLKYFPLLKKEECTQGFQKIVEEYFIEKDKYKDNKITVEAKCANKKIASLLHIAVNAPVLQIVVTAVDEQGHSYFCGVNSYAGDDFFYSD